MKMRQTNTMCSSYDAIGYALLRPLYDWSMKSAKFKVICF